MQLESDQILQIVGCGYVGLLVITLCWYGIRRSTVARWTMAALIIVPAGACRNCGLSLFLEPGGFHPRKPDAVVDVTGLAQIFGVGMCVGNLGPRSESVALLNPRTLWQASGLRNGRGNDEPGRRVGRKRVYPDRTAG
jgi:hypothetical protein